MKHSLKEKIIALTLTATLLFGNVASVIAAEPPTPPAPPTAPSAPTPPSTPTNDAVKPVEPTAPSSPDDTNTNSDEDAAEDQQEEDNDNYNQQAENKPKETQSTSSTGISGSGSDTQNATAGSTDSTDEGTGGVSNNGNSGETLVETGDATSDGNINTQANTNVGSAGACCDGQSVGIINDGNGSESTNNGSATIDNNSFTLQDNSAVITNDMTQSTTTGKNSASNNVGSSEIKTGDALTTGTIMTGANTNVAVAEFNVIDDYTGDIILDFGTGCIANCGDGDYLVKNIGNGSDSTNKGSIDATNNDTTYQLNDAAVINNMDLFSDSGNNTASRNTGGDNSIETGDATTVGNVLTFVNNNLAGNIVFGVVNIVGNLVGDIILPESALASLCGGCVPTNILASNTGNGSDSTNITDITLDDTDNTFQFNDAVIENNLILNAQTGNNSANRNTGGDMLIETGDSNVDVQVLNIANSNIVSDQVWWLVIVNEAGNWVGKLFGAPAGSNYAGSSGTQFAENENGEITAINSGNGSGSTNSGSINQTNNTTLVQSNDAHVVNNIDLSANTGGNEVSNNTGGNSSVKTGDAKVVANLVNFVNNNIVGNGRLVVTFVNVIGSWMGDFLTPGAKKETSPTVASSADDTGESGDTSDDQGRGGQTNDTQSTTQNQATAGANAGTTGSTNGTSGSTGGTQGGTGTTNNGNGASDGSSAQTGTETNVVVAGIQNADVLTAKDAKRKLTINLAWLLLAIPLMGITYIVRKTKTIRIRLLPRR